MDIDPKNLHRMVWPFDMWKDKRVVNIPLTYLRSFIKNCKDGEVDRKDWVRVAEAEIKRRHFTQDHVFVTEHAVERFTQHFPKAHIRYLALSGKTRVKAELRPGQISFIKLLFKKALSNGVTTKAVGNETGAGNYHVKYRHFRWTYGLYGTGVKEGLTYEYKIISVVPTNNSDENPLRKKKDKQ